MVLYTGHTLDRLLVLSWWTQGRLSKHRKEELGAVPLGTDGLQMIICRTISHGRSDQRYHRTLITLILDLGPGKQNALMTGPALTEAADHSNYRWT